MPSALLYIIAHTGQSGNGPVSVIPSQPNLEWLDPLLGQLRCLFSFNLRFMVDRLDLARALSLGCR